MTTAVPSVVLLFVTLAPAASGDDALPGRDGAYEFAGVATVEGTVWKGETNPGEVFIVRFEKGGILCYTSPSGTFRNGTWTQKGNAIYLEMNQRYAEYRGVLAGNRLTGTAGNITGLTWTWSVQRSGTIAAESLAAPRQQQPTPFGDRDPVGNQHRRE